MIQLKPQDVVIAVKMLTWSSNAQDPKAWSFESLGQSLGLGHNQTHLAYKRLVVCDLVAPDFRLPIKKNLVDFLIYGLRHVFPSQWAQEPEKGMLTGVSGPIMQKIMASSEPVLWPIKNARGVSGRGLYPIHECVPQAAKHDRRFYEIMTVIDCLRAKSARERELAHGYIKDLVLGSS